MKTGSLLFDLDGTLVDSAAGIATALSILSRERGGPAIHSDAVRPLVSLGAAALVSAGLGPYATTTETDVAAFRAILRETPADPATIFPGVIETLAQLRASGHAMAIVTNKPEYLARKLLDGLDMVQYFDAIVGGDTAQAPKPDPSPLHLALRSIGGQASRAILIGDSEVDAGAAANCAVPFILFEGGYGAEQCAPFPVAARFALFEMLPDAIASTWPG